MTKEFVTSFGCILYLPNTVYKNFVKKVKKLEERQPDTYFISNSKEIFNQWFPEDSPEDIVNKIYGKRN